MNSEELQRTGSLGAGGETVNIEQTALRSARLFSSPTQTQLPHLAGSTKSPMSSMSLVSQLTSPPVAGSHASALQQLHLQSAAIAGAKPGTQSLLGAHSKPSPARSLSAQYHKMGAGRGLVAGRGLGSRTTHVQDYYFRKWKRLKKLIKDTVFINASVCDEVIRVEEKLARSKEERRFLLRKLLQYQALTEASTPVIKQEVVTPSIKAVKAPGVTGTVVSEVVATETTTPVSSKSKSTKKKAAPSTTDKKKTSGNKELIDSLQPKPKKSKGSGANRRIAIPPIPLDPTGRPVFPLVLGDLTVHSLGELNPERSCFHCSESIYPVGFCSTRVYTNISNTDIKCLYTCKISDSGPGPVFEIAPDDSPDKIWKCKSPSDCHTMLLRAINQAKGLELTPTGTSGLDFFGLTHPVVQNLIQSLPGARKCSGYKWHKFEVNKGEVIENIVHCPNDPVINYESLRKLVSSSSGTRAPTVTASAHLEPSTSLRSLLTSGPFSTFSQK